MPTSAPGSKPGLRPRTSALRRGFTLLELLLVLAIVAITAGVASLALRDNNSTQLEREAVRLAALLEMARAESRVTGTAVRWMPEPDDAPRQAREDGALPAGFRFLGLSRQAPLARHWMQPAVTAQVPPPGWLVLGPEAILPRQRVLLRLEDQVIEISSDGLGPFVVAPLDPPTEPAAR
jgi:general secretion pathway protein H